jgi:hypothetical protein
MFYRKIFVGRPNEGVSVIIKTYHKNTPHQIKPFVLIVPH